MVIYDRIVATAASVALAIGAIIATIFAVLAWQSDQPSMNVELVRSDVRSVIIDATETSGKLESIELEYAGITGFAVLELVAKAQRLDETNESDVTAFIASIRQAVIDYEQYENASTDSLEKAFTEIAAELDQKRTALELLLEIRIDVENESNSPNIIRGHALVRLWKDAYSFRDVDVYLKDEDYLNLAPRTIERVIFESRYTGTMDDNIAVFLQRNSVEDLTCLLLVKDIAGNTWSKNDRCVTDIGLVTSGMQDEAGRLFGSLHR